MSTNNKSAPLKPRRKKPSPLASKATKNNDETTPRVDYKDITLLRKFISDRGKIRARRVTGVSDQEQREVASAIKNAREMALLPYTSSPR